MAVADKIGQMADGLDGPKGVMPREGKGMNPPKAGAKPAAGSARPRPARRHGSTPSTNPARPEAGALWARSGQGSGTVLANQAQGAAQARPPEPASRAAEIPASMMRYMTFELAEALKGLSQQQVQGIFRIVEAGHLVDEPPAPYWLIRGAPGGPPPICSETVWKRAGKRGDNGKWLERPGWSHQEEFLRALQMAKRLARQQWTQVKMSGVEKAVGLLQAGVVHTAQRLLEISTGYQMSETGEFVLDGEGKRVQLGVEIKDQIAAGKTVLGVALEQARLAKEDAAAQSPEAQAWWDAAATANDEE